MDKEKFRRRIRITVITILGHIFHVDELTLDRYLYISAWKERLDMALANFLGFRKFIAAVAYVEPIALPGNFSGRSANRNRRIKAELHRHPLYRLFRK
jgi:hypothetical protein